MTRRAYFAEAQRIIRGQLAASRHNKSKRQMCNFACRFGFVLETPALNLAEIIFPVYCDAADAMV